MLETKIDDRFDVVDGYGVALAEAKVFSDSRGSFAEVLVGDEVVGLKQINRSKSVSMTVRGCHAQRGEWCQAKLVEAVNRPIYDIITDARPDSKTFGTTQAYLLDPLKQNKVYVPKGFLHAFAVPESDIKEEAVFMYYCDNVFNKQSEICVSPMTLLPAAVKLLKESGTGEEYEPLFKMFEDTSKLVLSEKDLQGQDYEAWMSLVQDEWRLASKCWYKA